MATKIIKTWINGVVQEIEVEDIVSSEQMPSLDERVEALEDKPIIAEGNFLIGDGTTSYKEMTPAEVLSHINGASITTMTTAEYEAMGDDEANANMLYLLTDSEDKISKSDLDADVQASLKKADALPTVTVDNAGQVLTVNAEGIPEWQEVSNGEVNLNGYQPKTDENLETESKEVVGAINELNAKHNSIVGAWAFKETLNFDALHPEQNQGTYVVEVDCKDNFGTVGVSLQFVLSSSDDCSLYISESVEIIDGELGIPVWIDGGYDDIFTALTFLSDIKSITPNGFSKSDFNNWLKENFTKQGDTNGADKITNINIAGFGEVNFDPTSVSLSGRFSLVGAMGAIAEGDAYLSLPIVAGDNVSFGIIGTIGSGENQYLEISANGVPSCSSADNGKFLRVVNGVPAWVTIPNAEEATF